MTKMLCSTGRDLERGGARRRLLGIAAAAFLIGSVAVPALPAAANPTWVRQASPNAGANNNLLWTVSCVSPSYCIGVGKYRNTNKVDRTLIESWNGTAWSRIASPNAGANNNELSSVSCVTQSWCVAVGFYRNFYGVNRTLILRWNGVSWSRISSPNAGARHNYLNGVACISETSCIAVGFYANTSGVARTLTESWNGVSWIRKSSPNVGASHNGLYSVSCTAPTSCMAVGVYVNTQKADRTLIESWNGTTWSHRTSPNAGARHNDLYSVSCTAATSCTAVGSYINTSGIGRTLIVSWNGATWSRVSGTNIGARHNVLYGVSCTSATDCTAVGFYVNTSNVDRTLVESWNGTSWSHVASPNAGASHNDLLGVSCVSPTQCTAVGAYLNTSKVVRTLIEASK